MRLLIWLVLACAACETQDDGPRDMGSDMSYLWDNHCIELGTSRSYEVDPDGGMTDCQQICAAEAQKMPPLSAPGGVSVAVESCELTSDGDAGVRVLCVFSGLDCV